MFSNLLDDLLKVENKHTIERLKTLNQTLTFADRFYAVFSSEERERLLFKNPTIEWKEPILENAPRVVIPMEYGVSLGLFTRSDDVGWVSLLFSGETLPTLLQSWYYNLNTLSAEDIRNGFMENIGFFDISRLAEVSKSERVPFIVNKYRIGMIANESTVFPNISAVYFENIGVGRTIIVTAVDKDTGQHLSIPLSLSATFFNRLENLLIYFQQQFEGFGLFS